MHNTLTLKLKQRGVSLAISLVMLLVISIISVSAIRVATMDEKMTSNMADKEMSFQASESGLMQAEKWLMQLALEPVAKSACEQHPCVKQLDTSLDFTLRNDAWWSANAGNYNTTSLIHINKPPRYYVEHYRFVPDNPTIGNGVSSGFNYYRVTSRGLAGSDNSALSILQTSIARRF